MSRLKEMDTPVFWVEGHPGTLDREGWTVEVTGLCESPLVLTWDDLMKMKKTVANARLTSVTRFSVRGLWGGIKISDILQLVRPLPDARFCRFWSIKKIYDTSIPMETVLQEKTLLAYEFDGEPLEEDYGGPVRGFCPYLWGYKSAKSVVKIELMDHYISGYWEKRGYSDDAIIVPGMVRDINDRGRLKKMSLEDCI